MRLFADLVEVEGDAMNAVISMAVVVLAAGTVPDSLSPDGQRAYSCGSERLSAAGCFNA